MTTVREHFGVATVLWWTTDHYNHVHIDFDPPGVGLPSCAGGSNGWPYPPGSPGLAGLRAALQPFDDPAAPFGVSFAQVPGSYDLGAFNCRHIGSDPDAEWSQHAYGNAQDVGAPAKSVGDAVVAWLDSEWEGDDMSVADVKEGILEALGIGEGAGEDLGDLVVAVGGYLAGDPLPTVARRAAIRANLERLLGPPTKPQTGAGE